MVGMQVITAGEFWLLTPQKIFPNSPSKNSSQIFLLQRILPWHCLCTKAKKTKNNMVEHHRQKCIWMPVLARDNRFEWRMIADSMANRQSNGSW